MAKLFTSDLHFLHKRITEYTKRGDFVDAVNHTQWVLDTINKQVKGNDILYHPGDFAFTSDANEIIDILERINCQVVAVKGNHCSRKTWKHVRTNKLIAFKDYDEIKMESGKTATLFHFPVHVWHKQHYGSYALHGHTHGSYQGEGKILDVGLDNSYNLFGEHRLFTETDIEEFMSKRDVVVNDHHKARSGEM